MNRPKVGSKIKPLGIKQSYTAEQLVEILKCQKDPIYFIEKYIKIVTLDDGIIPFILRDYQKKMIDCLHNNRFSMFMLARQSGKSITIVAYFLYYTLLFSNKRVTISAHKSDSAKERIQDIIVAYENIPSWLQQGVGTLNKNTFEFENGSSISATTTSTSTGRGGSKNIILLDEFAFVEKHLAEEFYASIYPTVSQSKTSKVIIVSTPNGMGNKFYKMWNDSLHKKNEYKSLKFTYRDVPLYQEKGWRERQTSNMSEIKFNQEYACEFLGSSATLINAETLRNIATKPPIKTSDGLDIYEDPIEGHTYFTTVDPSNFTYVDGDKQDYSAFCITDITTTPYKVVAKYRNNKVSSSVYPELIYKINKNYNFPHTLCEVNNHNIVGEALHNLQMPNLLMGRTVAGRGGKGQDISHYFDSARSNFGIVTSDKTKIEGCMKLKDMIENHILLFEDDDILNEFLTFVPSKKSWAASAGNHDDLVMCLVLFAWASNTEYFKQIVNLDIRKMISKKEEENIDLSLSLLGFVDLHIDSNREVSNGCVWYSQGTYGGYGLPGVM